MNEEQQRIWEYLKANSVGRNNAIHIADLANNLGFFRMEQITTT